VRVRAARYSATAARTLLTAELDDALAVCRLKWLVRLHLAQGLPHYRSAAHTLADHSSQPPPNSSSASSPGASSTCGQISKGDHVQRCMILLRVRFGARQESKHRRKIAFLDQNDGTDRPSRYANN
jgi:hypothetical protein